MAEKFRAKRKNKLVKIYSLDKVTENGRTVIYRTYHYPEILSAGIHAYVRYQGAAERNDMGIVASALTIVVYINWRLGITVNQYVEYDGGTYQVIIPPDPYEFGRRELKLTCTSTAPQKYDAERYADS